MIARTVALLLVVACSAPAADRAMPTISRARVEPDDLAVLYPLVERDGGYLTPGARGRGGELIPPEVYERAFGAPGTLRLGGTPAAPALAGLRLVAFRLDPCFAALPPIDETRCENQIRLVFQTLVFDGGHAIATDEAVHAFYALDRAQLAGAVDEMTALRGNRQLGPLAVHPILASEGVDGELGKGFANVVLRYAGAANLTRITAFTSSGLGTAWNFFGVDVSGTATSPVAIPTLPGVELEAFFAGFTRGELGGAPAFTPASTRLDPRDDLRSLADRASAVDRRRALEAAQRIENPMLHSANTIDCVSCHVARSLQTGGEVDVHMFGYKGRVASIQPRTIHEVDAAVAYLDAARTIGH